MRMHTMYVYMIHVTLTLATFLKAGVKSSLYGGERVEFVTQFGAHWEGTARGRDGEGGGNKDSSYVILPDSSW